MRKIYFFILAIFLITSSNNLFAQAADYIFSTSSGTYTPITGTISTATGDDGVQTAVPIGFTFNYCGTNYTTFSVSTNGYINFGTSNTWTNDLASLTYKPIIAPLWDDLYDDASSDVQYTTIGTTPNRVLTVQWRNIRWLLSGGSQQNFQLKLYETTNVIEFIYGAMLAPIGSASASIGINDATGGAGHFLSITPGTTPTYSSTVANNTINAATNLTNGLTYIFTPSSCISPGNLAANAITQNSADLSWSTLGTTTNLEWGVAGFTLGTGTPVAGLTTTNYNLIGLLPSTSYSFYVQNDCGGGVLSSWSGPFTFATQCNVFTAPFVENFNTTTIPNCWTMSGPQTWLFTNTWPAYGAAIISGTDHTGTGGSFAGVDGSGTASLTGIMLQTPLVDVSTLTVPELKFYLFNNNTNDVINYQTLVINLWDGAVWHDSIYVWGPTNNDPSWKMIELSLGGYTISGAVQVQFVVNKSAGSPFYDDLVIDDVSIEEAPTCPSPVSLTATGVSDISANLSWNNGSSETLWDIQFDTTGFALGTGTIIQNINTNPYTLTGLTPNTTYQYYVLAQCSGTDSSIWAGPYSFTTLLTSCTGVPVVGTASAPASVCASENFNLTLTGFGTDGGINFQWQSSPDNSVWSNIAGATTSTYLTTQISSTYYRCIVSCTFSGLSDTSNVINVTMNLPQNCYCTSNATSTGDEEILNVSLGTLNNTSTCTTTGGTGSILNEYSNYTALPAPNLIMSLTSNLSVEVGTCGGNYNNGVSVWIDYNQNGSFADAGERVYFSPATTSGPHIETASILIPITATPGLTRMRVICSESAVPSNPCGTYTWGETEDYTVNILPVPTCPQPTNLTASGATQTTVQVGWTNGGSETSWDIEYGLTGFTQGTGTIINNVPSNPYTITGLTPSSEYQYYVIAQCSPTDSSYWSGPYSFSTLCGPMTALYVQKFDAVTAPAIPNCWSTIVLGSSGAPFVQTTVVNPTSAPNCAQMFNSTANGSSTHIILVAPQFSDLPTHTTQVRFMARCSGTGIAVLHVGTMSNPTNPTTFSTFQSLTGLTSTWQEFVVPFSGYMGSNQVIAFKHGLAQLNQNIYIDDFYYETIPTCPKPLQITTSNITDTSVTIDWNPGGSETQWNIEYGLTGFTQGTGTTVVANAHPYVLSGLSNSTDFDFYIQAYCGPGDSSVWQGPFSFSTLTCLPSAMCMYYLSGTDSYGDGWNGASVTIKQNGATVKVFTLTGGTALTDSVSLCSGANITLDWVAGSYPSECGFSMTDFYGYPVTGFATGSAPSVGTFFTFTGNCNPPSCPRVTNLSATNLTPTSADLTWTNGGSESQWEIEYGIFGFAQVAGTFTLANSNPYTLTGLSQGVSYSYYVRAICGAGDTSIWNGPYSFTLPCVPYTATYTQNFDAVTIPNIPLCWTSKVVATTNGAYVNTTTTAPNSAPNCAELYNYSNTGATTHVLLISPHFSDMTNHLNQVRFSAKGSSGLIVGTMTDPNDENTFTALTSLTLSSTNWNEYIISLVGYNGTNEYIAFKHAASTTYSYVYIDDFYYEPAPGNDIAVTQIVSPNAGCGLTSTESITCKIKNFGAVAQSNIPLGYNLNGGATVGPETYSGTINPGDSAIYTFTATADFTTYGNFVIKAFNMDATDMYHPNDTAQKSITSSALVNTFPFIDDFETVNNYWTSGGNLNSWQLGMPAGTSINTAPSGTHVWMTNLTGNYNNSENSYVVGPCFDFSTLTNPYVRLKRSVNAENSWDGAALQSSIDGGLTWQHVGALGDPNGWYNDGTINGLAFSGSQEGWTGTGATWVTSTHTLLSLAGQSSVKFRIVFGADGSVNSYDGFAFDDFEILEPADLAIVSPLSGTYQQCGMSATDTLTICVKNVGTTTIPMGDNIYAWYKVDLNAPVADTLTLTSNLLPGDSLFLNFSQTYDFSAYTSYLVNYWISYLGDNNTSNDTIGTTMVNYQLTVAIQGGDTILTDPLYLPYTLLIQGSPYTYDTYFWSNATGTATGTNNTFDALALGWYYLTVTGGTCTATDSVFLGDITSSSLNAFEEGISIYPNPSNGKFYLELTSPEKSDYIVELIASDGRTIDLKKYTNTNKVHVYYNEQKLAEGIYYLKITGDQKQYLQKIVKY